MNSSAKAVITLLAAFSVAPALTAQSPPLDPIPLLSLNVAPTNPLEIPLAPPPPTPEKMLIPRTSPAGPHVSKIQFIVLSSVVYIAATADMYQTTQVRNFFWWSENDPLARPFIHLPTPAYYATGLAMATGLNWLSWKMAHSRRFHRLAPLPQLATIAGNLHGVATNIH